MAVTSKTGLLPTPKKFNRTHFQETRIIQFPTLVKPAPFTLRPFAGIYNPFPYGCSVLCNHPADFEAKSVVKKAKDAWAAEGKSLIDVEELSAYRTRSKSEKLFQNLSESEDKDDQVPQDLFRKFTSNDSRPLTPAPTLASVATKGSQNVKARRCMTPDPTSFIPTKEKTLLVLDLRRSHSQDAVYWPGGQILETGYDDEVIPEGSTSRTTSPSNQTPSQVKKKKPLKKKPTPTSPPKLSGPAPSLKSENSKDSDSKIHTQFSSGNQSPSKGSLIHEPEPLLPKTPPISRESSSVDVDVVKRRGKKRKGKKTGKDGKEGDKEFKGIPDPGETQVSALENDSKEGSSRPSLSGDENVTEMKTEGISSANPEQKCELGQYNKSFLRWEILKQLQRQLDQEVVDSEFNEKRRIALQEALRCKVNLKLSLQGEEMKNLRKEFRLQIENSEKWLSIPRIFTRRSSRFELPMDSRLLNKMTPLQYVENYVFASPERLVLYNHVFNLHKEEPEDDDETIRILLGKNVVPALGEVMGRSMTEEEAKEFQDLIDWKDDGELSFRTFTGISATCERLMAPKFCSKMLSHEEDPRHEVEIADFESLDGKLKRLNPDERLVKILRSVRDL